MARKASFILAATAMVLTFAWEALQSRAKAAPKKKVYSFMGTS
jgi:hypothetical protein